MRAWQGDATGSNQAGNTKTGQYFFKIHICHFTLL